MHGQNWTNWNSFGGRGCRERGEEKEEKGGRGREDGSLNFSLPVYFTPGCSPFLRNSRLFMPLCCEVFLLLLFFFSVPATLGIPPPASLFSPLVVLTSLTAGFPISPHLSTSYHDLLNLYENSFYSASFNWNRLCLEWFSLTREKVTTQLNTIL